MPVSAVVEDQAIPLRVGRPRVRARQKATELMNRRGRYRRDARQLRKEHLEPPARPRNPCPVDRNAKGGPNVPRGSHNYAVWLSLVILRQSPVVAAEYIINQYIKGKWSE